MQVDEIRKTAKLRPFKTFIIQLDNGVEYHIGHPENIFITDAVIVTVDEKGRTIYIAPEAVSNILLLNGHE